MIICKTCTFSRKLNTKCRTAMIDCLERYCLISNLLPFSKHIWCHHKQAQLRVYISTIHQKTWTFDTTIVYDWIFGSAAIQQVQFSESIGDGTNSCMVDTTFLNKWDSTNIFHCRSYFMYIELIPIITQSFRILHSFIICCHGYVRCQVMWCLTTVRPYPWLSASLLKCR